MNDSKDAKRIALDDQIDAALAKFAAVEPRTGLEDRILANLRLQQQSESRTGWWRWAVPMAAALLIVSIFVWRAERHGPEQAVRGTHLRQDTQTQTRTNIVAGNSSHAGVRKHRVRQRHIPPTTVVEAEPKLEQFPSPRPLSEQEKLLAEYVSQFQEEAVVVARARAEVLRRDLEQMQHATEADDGNNEHTR